MSQPSVPPLGSASPSRYDSASSTLRAPSTVTLLNARRSYLDESALSPQEYLVYLSSFNSIKPAPSGQPDLVDEQDGLRYLREECAMSMADELEILPLFERTPLGLGSGHFFAMLRLVSWAQQGRSASKDLIFTQTKPARIALPKKFTTPQSASAATFGSAQQVTSPGPRSLTAGPSSLVSAPTPSAKPTPSKPDSSTKPLLTPVREESSMNLNESTDSAQSTHFKPPPAVPAKPQMPKLVAPKPKVANPNVPLNLEQLQRKPVPVPPSSSANPFRDGAASTTGYASGSGYAVAVGAISTTPANISTPLDALRGFDPAPNPFKQSKPRIVKPTPVRASSPASNPFRNGTPAMAALSNFPKVVYDHASDGASSQASSSRSRQQQQQQQHSTYQPDRLGAGSPPLPPRPGDRNPPPLPPRHISPLIQAGLNARSEVRRAQESLPPKTFTVLQSSAAKHHGGHAPVKPRLLTTGQTAPREAATVISHAKKRSVSGTKSLLGGSSAVGLDSRKFGHDGLPLQRRDSQQSTSDVGRNDTELGTNARRTSSQLHRGVGGGDSEVGAAISMVSHGDLHHHQQQQRTVPTVAPKPIYAKKAGSVGEEDSSSASKVKPTLPSWLKEQEELQREALASGSEPPPPPPIQPTEGGVRGRASRTVVEELTDSAEAMSDEAAAANAASIDRHNPFFPPHRRDEGRSPNPDAEGFEDSQVSSNHRPLGRSKTISGSGAGGGTRPLPPRRPRPGGAEVDSTLADDGGGSQVSSNAHWGHSLASGTYAGFKPNKEPKNSGGLRLVPPSKQAKMLNVATAEQLEQEGIRPASDLRKVSTSQDDAPSTGAGGGNAATSENSSVNGPLSPTTPSGNYPSHQPSGFMRRQGSLSTTIREKVSDILRLQDQPPKGQRQVDLLTQDLNNLVNKNEWLARKRDSFVRSTSGATGAKRERERLISSNNADDYAVDVDEEEERHRMDEELDDGPQPDTDPHAGAAGNDSTDSARRRSHAHQRSISGSGSGTGGDRDPFSSSPPLTHHNEHNPHLHQPPPQHPATQATFDPRTGLRRSGSLNPKRSSSYQYPLPQQQQQHQHQASYSATGQTTSGGANGNPTTASEGAEKGSNRRWSSFHQPHNSFSQLALHSNTFLAHSGGGKHDAHTNTTSTAKTGGIAGTRDLRGSAVDEEDADEDVDAQQYVSVAQRVRAVSAAEAAAAAAASSNSHARYAQLS
ncbi:hypothetical protein EX895_005487 [Sporisorium graminicola]|uniref:Uncharacterized protein n=1 Tax=Sporisorium graminicola TaxID=280036 RepID=A0A4U7KLX9_9BASI|nr:hypothetical protein EX895_005487 [Sporisorium graminicola]TKY85325.1 hypothetical protein EX895_005487 [Sporisorium graminicola]